MECRNCDTTINENQKFCSNCGEIINAKRLKLKSIIGLFFSNFFSFDNKFSRTFKDLIVKPEFVINSYINGYRRKYVNVIGYLGLALTLIGFQFFVLRRFFPELLSVDNSAATESIKINNEPFNLNSMMDSFYQYQGILTILFIPVYAVASKIAFLDIKKYNFAEHFVINIYANAHIFILWFAITLITLPFKLNYNLFSQFSLIIMFIYMIYTFRKLYSINTINSFARTMVYNIIAFTISIIIFLIFAIGYGFYLAYTGQVTPIEAH